MGAHRLMCPRVAYSAHPTRVHRGSRISILAVATIMTALSMASPATADPLPGKHMALQWCSECHAVAENDTSANPKAPPFPKLAAQPSITEYSLRVLLRTPHETMPNLILKPDEADELISYIMSLKSRP